MFSSAAAGVSLIAASLVLIASVSAVIGVRGFSSAREAPAEQRVVLKAPAADREAGSAAPVVIGSRRTRTIARRATRASRSTVRMAPARHSRAKKKRPARSGLSAPAAKRRPARPAPAARPPAPDPDPAPPAPAPTTTPADPVGEVLEAVENIKPVETVGDVLLDLRDVLP